MSQEKADGQKHNWGGEACPEQQLSVKGGATARQYHIKKYFRVKVDANNHLTNENIRLKTKNMNLEKELTRLQKVLEEDPQKMKLNPNKDIKLRGNDHTSIKMILRNIQKDLEDARKENTKIKTSIKFTTISEL
jgi:hypothetical protein